MKCRMLKATIINGRSYRPGTVLDTVRMPGFEKGMERLIRTGRAQAVPEETMVHMAPPVPAPLAPLAAVKTTPDLRSDEEKEAAEGVEAARTRLSGMTKRELQDEATKRGLNVPPAANKAMFVDAILEHSALHQERADAAGRGGEPAHVLTKWALDPAELAGQSVQDLNLMIAERSAGKVGPFDTVQECVAQLTKDFRPPK